MRYTFFFFFALLLVAPVWSQTGSISGTVFSSQDDGTLPGANVLIAGTAQGTTADLDGNFMFSGLDAGSYALLFSYTGFQNVEMVVDVVDGEDTRLTVELVAGIELDPVQITAGRRQEKVLESPASISVVNSREITLEAPQTTVRALRNVAGVDIVQTGIDRHEVALRGFANVFSGATHILTDYRQANAAVIGVNIHSIMPALPLDIDRVEVVRGAGAALYGPGVDAGVIHYITKDAFTHPGITLTVGGGQRSQLNIQGRVAAVLGRKLGIKISGVYSRGNDFELEFCDMELIEMGLFDQCPDAHDAQQVAIDGPRVSEFDRLVLSGYGEYRFGSRTSLHVSGGLGRLSGTILSGIGTIQGDNFIGSWGQVRLNSGPFFLQAYTNGNDSGDSYVYNGDPVTEFSRQTNVQGQYTIDFGGDRQELIVGADLELINPDSRGTVFGRNEENDNITEIGAYVQSKTRLGSKLDLVVAIRGDHHSVFEEIFLSPRLGLVFKPSTSHSFRATYNRTVVNPSGTALFLDLIAARITGNIPIRARGGAAAFTWNRNPVYLDIGAPTDLVASSLIPGMEGVDTPVGLPTGTIYGLVYGGLAATPDDELALALITALDLDPALAPLLTSQIGTIKMLLHPDQTVVQGFSQGQLGLLNLTTQQIDPGPSDLQELRKLEPQKSRFWELGYTGILGDRVLLSADVYYAQKRNFVGGLQMATPFVLVPDLIADLTRDLGAGIEGNEDLLSILDLLGAVAGLTLTPEAAASLIVNLAAGSLPAATTPVAIVQPVENNAGVGNIPELLVGYPNFGEITYWGADVALQVLASEKLSLFGNLSWVSDDFFDNKETGEVSETAVLSLNAPAMKFKLGATYTTDFGLSVTGSGRYIDSFDMISGQYIGKVESYFLLDLGLGYDFGGGLRADVNISNVLDNVHREFIGAPKLGRVATARMLYTMNW